MDIQSPPETLEEFERRLGLADRSFSKQQAATRLGISERALDTLIVRGEIQAYRIGTQKLSFLGSDLAALLFERRVHVDPVIPREPKPRSDKQMNPPRNRRGRPPKIVKRP